jgi:multicomponent Na+:H+ antiporter subunit G
MRKYRFMNIIVTALLICGLVFFAGGAVGIIRFPDFYSRLHPAGKLDTAGLATTMGAGALALYTASSFSLASLITALKIILIFVFVFITSPTATHAIIDAGVRAGLMPWRKEPEADK